MNSVINIFLAHCSEHPYFLRVNSLKKNFLVKGFVYFSDLGKCWRVQGWLAIAVAEAAASRAAVHPSPLALWARLFQLATWACDESLKCSSFLLKQ